MENYSAIIAEASTELTARERIMFKDTSNAVHLDEVTKSGPINVKPTAYVILDIHNEKSDSKDYKNYIVVAEDGTKYVTGSTSFWNSFKGIWDELGGEDFEISIYRKESKNYKGKDFITCSVI